MWAVGKTAVLDRDDWAMVCLLAAPQLQLSVSVGSKCMARGGATVLKVGDPREQKKFF